ncbi:MAG: FAD-dependent oxidoreductase [Candidatus Limnocylindria bacterium]
MLERLADEPLDLLVIGGGITGAGVAREAALRGLRVGLVERADFAAGTSSRSTKLIHGGLRYLRNRELGFVRESVRERERLMRMAPHLVRPLPFVFPVYAGDPDPLWKVRVGLALYDRFAGHEKRIPRAIHRADGLREIEPLLASEGLRGGAVYGDSITDDARLVLAVVRSAGELGALAANYAAVIGFERDARGRSRAAIVRDEIAGAEIAVRAGLFLNATGPWADRVRHLADPGLPRLLRLTKGVHIAVRRERLPVGQAVVLRARDGRIVFAIPSGAYTYVGTTDTNHDGEAERAAVERADVEYLLEAVGRTCRVRALGTADVTSAWVGLRPLIAAGRADPSQVSRDYDLFRAPSGVVTVGGGKLTAFRAMASRIVDRLFPRTRRRGRRVEQSRDLLPGATTTELPSAEVAAIAQRVGEPREEVERTLTRYGSAAAEVLLELARLDGGDPNLAWWTAQLRHAVRAEMAVRLEDVLARRTSALLFTPDNGMRHATALATAMGRLLDWDDARVEAEVARYRSTVRDMWEWLGGAQVSLTAQAAFAGRDSPARASSSSPQPSSD